MNPCSLSYKAKGFTLTKLPHLEVTGYLFAKNAFKTFLEVSRARLKLLVVIF